MKPAITIILALTATPALAADWVALGKAGAVDQYFYDRSKLTIKDDQITYWKKVLFFEPQNINGKEVASGLLRERIDCAEHTAKLISYLYYATTGETVEYIAKDESEAAPIIPDTVGDAFEQKLCPLVWRKQEEARIKAEQRAAEAELSAIKRTPATEQPAAAPGAPAVRGEPTVRSSPAAPAVNPGTLPTPGQTPADSNAAPVVPAPAAPVAPPSPAAPVMPPVAPAAPAPAPASPNSSAAPIPRQPLPMPQIIEQLY
jgi:hypothetical protein